MKEKHRYHRNLMVGNFLVNFLLKQLTMIKIKFYLSENVLKNKKTNLKSYNPLCCFPNEPNEHNKSTNIFGRKIEFS